jgi:diguanylate cyclase (GGDEF)-like protein
MDGDQQTNDHALLEEVRELKNILSVAQLVVSSLKLDEVLQNILHSAMAIMDFPAGSIALYNEADGSLELHVHAGLSETFTARKRWTAKPHGLTHEILGHGKPFVVEDTEAFELPMNPLTAREGVRALIAMPLIFQKHILGILYIDDFKPRVVEQSRLNLLSILASFAAMSIDNAHLYRRTMELASTDGLTGLFNHRQFERDFCQELCRAGRYHTPLSVIMLDVDNFKNFNDSYGHPNGDIVLREMAGLMRELLRDCDLVYRYGGEEFIALLPETGLNEALIVAERIRIFVETESPRFLTGISKTHGVTVSIGVASFPEDGADGEALLKNVDDLMYLAKGAGKNKVYHRGDMDSTRSST